LWTNDRGLQKLDTANPKPLEERIWEDFKVPRQGFGKSTKYLFSTCLKILEEGVVAECPLDGQ